MKNLEFNEIEAIVRKQSSKRREEESLWTILLQHSPCQSLNDLWIGMNVVFGIGICIALIADSKLLGLLIVFIILSNGIFYANIERWNNQRMEKSLVENFNTSPEYFDKVLERLGELKAYYLREKDALKKKISSNGLLEWDERRYYEKELIPTWDRIIWSIESDIEWCKDHRINSMRRRDGIGKIVVIQSILKPHHDLV